MGQAGLILFAVACMAWTHPATRRLPERLQASASLRRLTNAEADFRSSDRESSRIVDFWSFDVVGLYGLPAPEPQGPRRWIRRMTEWFDR
jgi:hypothetical protein